MENKIILLSIFTGICINNILSYIKNKELLEIITLMNNRIRRIEKHVGKNVDFQSIEVVIPQENEEVKKKKKSDLFIITD